MIHHLSWHQRFLIPLQGVIYHKWLDFYLGQFEDVPDLALSYYPTMVLQEYFTWWSYCCYYPMVLHLQDYLSDASKNLEMQSRILPKYHRAFTASREKFFIPVFAKISSYLHCSALLPVRSFCWDAQLLLLLQLLSRDMVLSVDFLFPQLWSNPWWKYKLSCSRRNMAPSVHASSILQHDKAIMEILLW